VVRNVAYKKKKEAERRYIEAFFQSRPDLQVGPVQDEEEPDFLLQESSPMVGVEVTYFTAEQQKWESSPEEQDSLRQRVMQIAQTSYKEAGGRPLEVQVIFRPDCRFRLSKRRAPQLAQELADLVLPQPENISLWQQMPVDTGRDDLLPPEIEGLSTLRVPTHEHGGWFDQPGGWTGHATKADIVRIVAPKELKIPVYRKKCEEIWLLIVFRPVGDSTYLRPPTEPLPFSVATSFDRIFCMEPFGPRSLEVPVTRRTPK